MTPIGVLALQGDFAEHLAALRGLGVEGKEIRLPEQLQDIDGLIVPGGESTSIARLMDVYGIREPLKQRAREGMAVWGTCAGMIMLADRLVEDRPEPLHLMDIEVQRNAYGRQVDSFEADVSFAVLGGPAFHCVFIRAPKIMGTGQGVQALGTLKEGGVIAAQQGRLLVTAFHPELTRDRRFHRYFLKLVNPDQP